MSRPFPGIDPYLEMPPYWGDFTPNLLTTIQHQLLGKLLPDYDVCVEEYLTLTSEDGGRLQRVVPDISISTPHWWSDGAGATTVMEPTTAEMEYPEADDPETQRRLQVIHRQTQRVVTVLELLSPTNAMRSIVPFCEPITRTVSGRVTRKRLILPPAATMRSPVAGSNSGIAPPSPRR